MKTGYKAVIGLEVHAQLASQSKIFCADSAEYGGAPNTHISPISLGHPGTLPKLNRECVNMAIKLGLAMDCAVTRRAYFNRKNYFYPDLPKGYQVTQFDTPICKDGKIELRLKDGSIHPVRIQQIQLEEDAGKSQHDQDPFDTLVDLNRAGVGLAEIVSHPDMSTAEQAMAYLYELRKLVRYLEICDGNMEEGSFRCDANISVMKEDATEYGIRVEVKNMNSVSNVGRAINYEIERQIALVESGGTVARETRNWDAATGQTLTMRTKEEADDYRYFPEPDLLPVVVSDEMLQKLQAELPELPDALFEKFTKQLGLPAHDAVLLSEQREFSDYFKAVIAHTQNYKAAANWLNGAVRNYLNEQALDITQFNIKAESIAQLIALIDEGKVSHTAARDRIFPALIQNPELSPLQIAEAENLLLNSNADELLGHVQVVLAANADKVAAYKGGKTGLLGFFVGQVMKAAGGGADPKTVNELLARELGK